MEPITFPLDVYMRELKAVEDWLRQNLYGYCHDCKELRPLSALVVCEQSDRTPQIYAASQETITLSLKKNIWLRCANECERKKRNTIL